MVSKAASRYTDDHEEIRRWAETRGGEPATVKGTAEGDAKAGILRIDFPGYGDDEDLNHISWDDWFEKFDRNDLVMVIQEENGGHTSRFNKIVSRASATERETTHRETTRREK